MNLETLTAYVVVKKGNIPGKKAFQKIFYFLTESKIPTGLSYRIYQFGPYSSALDYKTDDLVMQGAINMQEPHGSSKTHHISPGFDAKKMLQENEDELKVYKDKIDRILDDLPDDPRSLELWSTIHFVVRSKERLGEEISNNTVIEAVKDIKDDKFDSGEIQNAYSNLRIKQLLN